MCGRLKCGFGELVLTFVRQIPFFGTPVRFVNSDALCTSVGARSVLNRKYIKILDRQKNLDEKYFFYHGENLF